MPKTKNPFYHGRKRPHLKLTRLLDQVGVRYQMSKYMPSKENLFDVGKIWHLKIEENYLQIPLTGDLQKFTLRLYYDSPVDGLKRLIQFHEETFGFGLPCVNPRTGRKSELVFEDSKIRYINFSQAIA